MKVGVIGLGRMGSRIARKLIDEGHEVYVWNRSPQGVENLKKEVKDLRSSPTVEGIVGILNPQRVVWLMLPQGEATQTIFDEVKNYLQKGDILIDGGNANWKDTEKRFEELKKKEIRFLGIGVSGGVHAYKNGFPLMVGGDKSAYEEITPLLDSLSKPNGGHEYFGEGGAGHFVKMVHNGVEYGMMQAIGEGFEVLEKSKFGFSLDKVAELWRKGTIVSGFLMDRAFDALSKDSKLSGLTGFVEESGEARWTVEAAKEEDVEVPIIEGSLEIRKRSQKEEKVQKSFTARLLAALRREFGGHSVKEN